MAADEGFSVVPPTAVPASGLDLAKLASGRVVEARVASLAEGIAVVATRHGLIQVDLSAFGKAAPTVGDLLRIQVQPVEGGARPAVTVVEHTPAADPAATPAPAADDPALVLARAVREAAASQTGLAPLYATLAGLAGAPTGSVPEGVRALVTHLMSGRLAETAPPNAEAVKKAFLGSGVFLESRVAGGAAAPQGDLKAALFSLRAALTAWVGAPAGGNASASSASGAGAAGAGAPGAGSAGLAATAAPYDTSGGRGATRAAPPLAAGATPQPSPAGPQRADVGASPSLLPPMGGALLPNGASPSGTPAPLAPQQPGGTPSPLAAPQPGAPLPLGGQQPGAPSQNLAGAPPATAPSGSPPPSASSTVVPLPPSATASPVSPPLAVPAPSPGPLPTATTPVPVVATPVPVVVDPTIASTGPVAAPSSPPAPAAAPPPSTGDGRVAVAGLQAAMPDAGGLVGRPTQAGLPTTAPGLGGTPPPGGSAVGTGPSPPPILGTGAPPAGEAGPTSSPILGAVATPASPGAGVVVSSMPKVGGDGALPVPPPTLPGGAVSPGVGAPTDPGPGDDAVTALLKAVVRGLEIAGSLTAARPAEASAALAGIAATQELRPPPPRRGQAPRGQAAHPVERIDDAGGVERLGRRALERTEGALSRILLEQFAVLDRRTDDPAQAQEGRGHREWTVEIPIATRQGTGVVQMMVEHDGGRPKADGSAGPRGWRVRFSLDVEPLGPIHAQIGFAAEKLSIGLWAERRDAAERLGGDVGRLRGALEAAAIPVDAIHLATGRPASGGPAPSAGHFVDVKL